MDIIIKLEWYKAEHGKNYPSDSDSKSNFENAMIKYREIKISSDSEVNYKIGTCSDFLRQIYIYYSVCFE